MTALTLVQLIDHIDLSYRQVDYAIRSGYINVEAPGSGHPRRISGTEAHVLVLYGDLTDAGLTARLAAAVARYFTDNPDHPYTTAAITITRAAA